MFDLAVAEVLGEADQVVRRAPLREYRRLQVVETAHLIAAAVRQILQLAGALMQNGPS